MGDISNNSHPDGSESSMYCSVNPKNIVCYKSIVLMAGRFQVSSAKYKYIKKNPINFAYGFLSGVGQVK
jgi:hypothetical protein